MSNSRRASRPTTRKKNVISPELTQPRRSCATAACPTLTDTGVDHTAPYADDAMLAQASAVITAANRTTALPVSVRRNCRSGVFVPFAEVVVRAVGRGDRD